MAVKKRAKKSPVASARAAKKPARRPAPKTRSGATKSRPKGRVATKRRPAPTKSRPKGRAATKRAPRPLAKSRPPSVRPKRAPRPQPKYPAKENPEALALAKVVAHAALEKKATDVIVIDTRARGAAVGYDYIVIASGESDRQLEAIVTGVEEALRPEGKRPAHVEASADWVLANFHDVVAHFFTPEARATYDLEGLWTDAPRVPVE
jgi:ribosome-associated protein